MSVGTAGVEYRELRHSDLPSFEGVVFQAIGALERATGIDQTSMSQIRSLRGRGMWTLISLLRVLGVLPIRFLVAVEGGAVRGTATMLSLPKAGYIAAVATDASARGRGIASHLLEQLRELARQKRKPWLALDVESENETALRVYRRLGYVEAARYGWHVGPTPAGLAPPNDSVAEVRGSEMAAIARWVDLQRPSTLRDPLPATRRGLSHLEIFSRPPRSKGTTWKLTWAGRTAAILRSYAVPLIQTAFIVPAACEGPLNADALAPLVARAIDWGRSRGATRTVVVVPEPGGAWEEVTARLGLPRAVGTTLMVRPVAA